jgi:hypothetical protein
MNRTKQMLISIAKVGPRRLEGLAAVFLIAIGSRGIASAQSGETRWVGVLSAGSARDCSTNTANIRWNIVEKDGEFIADSEQGRRWQVSTRNLKPDGSGRLGRTDAKGKPYWLEFEPGHGPRKILFNGLNQACVWTVTPLQR